MNQRVDRTERRYTIDNGASAAAIGRRLTLRRRRNMRVSTRTGGRIRALIHTHVNVIR